MTTQNRQELHFEKGQCYLGRDTSTPVDMSRPEFAGLKEVISKQSIREGDYAWDPQARQLVPSAGGSI